MNETPKHFFGQIIDYVKLAAEIKGLAKKATPVDQEMARILANINPDRLVWPDQNEIIRRAIAKVNQPQKKNISR